MVAVTLVGAGLTVMPVGPAAFTPPDPFAETVECRRGLAWAVFTGGTVAVPWT
jgi:hypothetical protein